MVLFAASCAPLSSDRTGRGKARAKEMRLNCPRAHYFTLTHTIPLPRSGEPHGALYGNFPSLEGNPSTLLIPSTDTDPKSSADVLQGSVVRPRKLFDFRKFGLDLTDCQTRFVEFGDFLLNVRALGEPGRTVGDLWN